MQKVSWWMSWPVIIITTIIFWPIGVFLICLRTKKNRKTALGVGKILRVIGWCIVGISVCGYIAGDIITALFVTLTGAVFLRIGKKIVQKADRTKQYIHLIVNEDMRSLESIVSVLGTSYEEVRKDLTQMLDIGYFPGAYIHEGNKEIVLKGKNSIHVATQETQVEQAVKKVTKIVTCNSCGANNSIVEGEIGECEFCGSPL